MEKLSLVRAIWSVPSASWTRWGEGPVLTWSQKMWKTCTEEMAQAGKVLDCLRPFQQEAHGFLSPESIAVLKLGLRSQYGDSSDSRRDLLDLL